MPKSGPREKRKTLRQQIKERKWIALTYFILRIIVVGIMIRSFLDQEYENFFLCVLTLILFLIPNIIEKRMRIDIPDTLETIVLLFIFSAEILGEIRSYYIHFPYWDTVLHTINGFLAAAIGFALVDILNKEEYVSMKLSPATMAIVAFSFSMTIGVVWEFFEYGMDSFFGLDMQKDTIVQAINSVNLTEGISTIPTAVYGIKDVILVLDDGQHMALGLGGYLDLGLHDTMQDLIVNFIGAFVFSIMGYIYVKARGTGRFKSLRGLLPTRIQESLEHEKADEDEIDGTDE